jgi:hypothetical protein
MAWCNKTYWLKTNKERLGLKRTILAILVPTAVACMLACGGTGTKNSAATSDGLEVRQMQVTADQQTRSTRIQCIVVNKRTKTINEGVISIGLFDNLGRVDTVTLPFYTLQPITTGDYFQIDTVSPHFATQHRLDRLVGESE